MTPDEALAWFDRVVQRTPSTDLRIAYLAIEQALRTARPVPADVLETARRLADGIPGRPALPAVIDEEIGDPALSDDVDVLLAYLLGRPNPETP